MVFKLLDITHLQRGNLQLQKVHFRINEQVGELIASFQHIAHHHQLIPQLEAQGQVFADKEYIGQVVTNLLSNAIKYSPEGSTVHVCTYNDAGKTFVTVRDKGMGIAQNKIDQVFNRYYRVKEGNELGEGLGLGLYISSQIIKQHGGEIGVTSSLGEGSTFWFFIPDT